MHTHTKIQNGRGKRETFNLLIHFLNICSSHMWVRLQPGTWYYICNPLWVTELLPHFALDSYEMNWVLL